MEVGNITKAATFKSFLLLSSKNTITFFMPVVFNIFMRQTTNDFWGLHKNMNCALPLNKLTGIEFCINDESHVVETGARS